MKMKDVERVSAEPVRALVHGGDDPRPLEVDARRLTYRYDVGHHGKASIAVVAVVSDRQDVWVGPEQDVYVETADGLMGLTVKPSGRVVWCRSLIDRERGEATVDEAVGAFEVEETVQTVEAARRGGNTDDEREANVTDLRPVFSHWAFTNGAYSMEPPRQLSVTAIEVSGGQVHLQLRNSASQFVGDVWIDLATRRVVRAGEGGNQILPR